MSAIRPLLLRGGDVMTGDSCIRSDVLIEQGRIANIGLNLQISDDCETQEVDGHTVCPGFIDLQCNGALGIDITTEPNRIWELGAHLPRWGVTSFLPTVITAPLGQIERARRSVLHKPDGYRGANPLGLHIEGPFLSKARSGAHPAQWLRLLKLDDVKHWSPENGVALVTLAPELDTDHHIIRTLTERGVVVSAGHTDATFEQMNAAVDAGLSMVTHLFNAMSPMSHRSPNVVGSALSHPQLRSGLICDGIHVVPSVVDLAFRLLGTERMVLVSDAVAALGLAPQQFRLGDTDLVVHSDRVTTTDGVLAGSVLSLDQAVRNLMTFTRCSFVEAARCATSTPAAVLRRTDIGALRVDERADIVVLTQEFRVAQTFVAGRSVFSSVM